jgi:arginine decarboxylase
VIGTIPGRYFIVCGAADAQTPLNAFDGALHNAGIGDLNLVRVSSIIPPNCRKVESHTINPGSLIAAAYASITSALPGEVIAAGIAVAIPEEPDRAGVVMEYSARGHREEIEEIVINMARGALEMRGLAVNRLESRAVDVKVENVAAAFAGVVLI